MEFYENRAKRPFYLFIWMGKLLVRWYRINQTRRILNRLSDEHLRDIGLSRADLGRYGQDSRMK
ncbi:DUF1127 domain-containing protein [Enterobacter sp. MW07]|nr:DUF1127 domain-containing protein [Enterobacter sp. MW07]